MTKADDTRRRLLASALTLFQKRGVEATTMRAIAKAAKLSLGAAYYYFPSKDALVFAYYEDNQLEAEAVLARLPPTASLRERLGALFHGKLASIREQRAMLAAILPRLIDPRDPLSAFSTASRGVRDRAIATFERALADAALPADVRPLAAHALWLLLLAFMLVYVNDSSEGEVRTHGLVDDTLDLIVPLAPLMGTPMVRALAERVTTSLARAEIRIAK